MSRRTAAGSLAGIIIIGLIYVCQFELEWAKPEKIRDGILSVGFWGPLVYVLCNAFRPFFLFPAIILGVAGGLAFGPLWGTIYLIIGTVIGAVLCFGLARQLGRDRVKQFCPKWISLGSLEEQTECHGFRAVVIMRLLPLLPWDAVSFLAGFSRVSFGTYVAATIVGSVPGAIAFSYFGSALFRPQPIELLLVAIIVITSIGIRFASRIHLNKS